MFNKIKGQKRAKKILKNSLKTSTISQSYLFYGPPGIGKFTTALYFAMALNCTNSNTDPCGECHSCKQIKSFNYQDLLYIFPTPNLKRNVEGRIKNSKFKKEYDEFLIQKSTNPWKKFYFSTNTMIRVDSIRMLQNWVSYSLHKGNRKVVIVEDADKMNFEAANAFLKTLEEPPDDTVIILTANKINSLLPTILSRCQKIQFTPLTPKMIETELEVKDYLDEVEAKTFARISNGNMEKALQLAEENEFSLRNEAIELVKICLNDDDIEFLNFLAKYKSSSKKNEMLQLIDFLIIFFSDILFLINDPEEIVNIDFTELLENVYHNNPDIEDNLPEFINFLESMKTKITRNVNSQLIFSKIFFEIQKII